MMGEPSSHPSDAAASETPRVFGYRGRMVGQPRVEPWSPVDEATVDGREPLPEPPPRGPSQLPPPPPQPAPQPVEAAKAPEPEPPKPAQPPPPPKTQPPVAKKSGPSRPETAHDKLLSRTQQMVRERPEDGAKLLRTILVGESEPEGGGAAGDESAPPVMQKVAILMVALGQETAAEMMKFLSDFEIEEITKAVVNLKNVTTQMQDRVLEEFRQHLEAGEWVSQGGMDFARNVLERAVGPRKAQEILERVSRSVSSGFYLLKNVAPEQVAPFIAHEHPQTIALILSQLDAARSGGILDQLPARLQADVSYRMATMESITPAVLKDIEEALEASLRDILGGNQDVGGPGVVADMLNMSGSSTEKNVLDQIDAQDPEISESIARLMFTFDDIVKLTDREMQVLLRVVDQKDLVIALKAAQEALKDKILGNLSEQTRQALTEEMEFIGPMRLSEVEEVQQRIVQQVRQLEENGEITIVRGDADDSFV